MANPSEILEQIDAATAETDNKIAALYQDPDDFHSITEVANRVGTTRTRVMVALYRMNLLPDRNQ